uniref:Uncharacterized protein n=2 Tax=Pan TaxID=9596 RepID=A0A2I3SIF3_PANTR
MAMWSMWAGCQRSASWESKGCPLPFSTATQGTAGEDCHSEDLPDDLGPSLAEQALRVKAVKLEKEVQDLMTPRYLESSISVRTWWRWLTFWRRLQSAFLKNQSLGTRSSLWRRSSNGCHF